MSKKTPSYETLVEKAPVGIFQVTIDPDHLGDGSVGPEDIYLNERLAQILSIDSPDQLATGDEVVEYADPADEGAVLEELEATGHVEDFETAYLTGDGDLVEVLLSGSIEDEEFIGYVTDISDRKELERKTKEQARAILEVEIPVVQVWDGVTLATVVGTLDTLRAQRLTERLLAAIMEDQSAIAILDITGVGTIDTATAQHLIETVNAVRLLGSEVIITGINPDIAQTMVNLNITMDEIETKASLADGLKVALRHLDDVVVTTGSD